MADEAKDDAKWKIETMASIAHYLKAHTKEATVIA